MHRLGSSQLCPPLPAAPEVAACLVPCPAKGPSEVCAGSEGVAFREEACCDPGNQESWEGLPKTWTQKEILVTLSSAKFVSFPFVMMRDTTSRRVEF